MEFLDLSSKVDNFALKVYNFIKINKEKAMKKLLKIISITLASTLILCGCDKIEDKSVSNKSAEVSGNAEESSEEKVEATLAERDRTVDTDTEFVFDDAKVLSTSDYDILNDYTSWISKTFKINAAVVTTSDIGDQTAEEYASDYYSELYDESNGIMFLVNNDTGTDYILRKGVPSLLISDSDIETLFSEISPMLVTGNYKDAINQTLELIELSLPEFAIDRTNKLDKDKIISINDTLAAGCSDGESLSIIYVGDIGEKKISDYAKDASEKYFSSDFNSALMVVNTQNSEYSIYSQGSLSELSDSQDDIKDSVAKCLTETDDKKSFDYAKIADVFVRFASK